MVVVAIAVVAIVVVAVADLLNQKDDYSLHLKRLTNRSVFAVFVHNFFGYIIINIPNQAIFLINGR